jgi:hypothetical protein
VDDYLCRGSDAPFSTDETFIVDELGVPKRRRKDGDPYYHPLNVARNTITYATNYFASPKPETLPRLRANADKMLELMTRSGGLPYPVEFHYYAGNHMLQPGWTSGMTQGVGLSAFARAYKITSDERYLEGGRRALAHLLTPIVDGGTATDLRHLDPTLAHYVWYEEYPNKTKPAYTLNGYMYTLVGLYDWSTVDPESRAKAAFDDGIVTLTKVLPYYDYDGFSAYDLAPLVYGTVPNFSDRYHSVHLMLLSALYAITHEPTLDAYAERWHRRVGGPIEECKQSSLTPQPRQ